MSTRHPARIIRAFTLIELMVVVAAVALLALIILPRFPRNKAKAQRAACTGNLKNIGLDFRTWSGDHNDQYPMRSLTNRDGTREIASGTNIFRCFQVMSNVVNYPFKLVCPADVRNPAKDFVSLGNNNLSYFVGLDADDTMPAMPLTGDRNLVTNGIAVSPGLLVLTPTNSVGFSATMHKFVGNLGLADGSVQQTTSAGLPLYVGRSGTNVTRLAIP